VVWPDGVDSQGRSGARPALSWVGAGAYLVRMMRDDRFLPECDVVRDWAWAALLAAWEGGDNLRLAELAECWLKDHPDDRDFRLWAADGLAAARHLEAAAGHLQAILDADPSDVEVVARLGHLYFRGGQIDLAARLFGEALALRDDVADVHYGLGLVAEQRHDYVAAERAFANAHRLDPDGFPLPVRLTDREFEHCLKEAVQELPAELQVALDLVAIVVQDLPDEESMRAVEPPDPELLGLFTGPTHGERHAGMGEMVPTIVLYRRNLERLSEDPDHLLEEITTTLYHELGHYLGWDEEEVARRGLE